MSHQKSLVNKMVSIYSSNVQVHLILLKLALNFFVNVELLSTLEYAKKYTSTLHGMLYQPEKELTMVDCSLGRTAWPCAFEILKKCNLSPMITHLLPLEEYSNALDLISSSIKVVLVLALLALKLVHDSKLLLSIVNPNDAKLIPIKDSVALVTGSSYGIGRAIAVALAKKRCKSYYS